MRDKFRDWNLYHKSIVVALAAIGFGIIIRALLVYDTAFEVKDSQIINADAATVWAWMIDDKNRTRWQAEMTGLVQLTGTTNEIGSKRLVFWQRSLKRWQSTERTEKILPGRVLELIQQSDTDTRWLTLSLAIETPCQTRLNIAEIIEPSDYRDRFWFFRARPVHEARLTASFEAMNRWMKDAAPQCILK